MKQNDKPFGRCQWDDCENEATKHRYKSVRALKLKDPVTKERIWFEKCFVCDACDVESSKEYDQLSFVAPYQK